MVDDVVRHYGRSTAAVAFVIPPRAAAMNVILGLAALMDLMRKHVKHKSQFLEAQLSMYGIAHKEKCARSPVWERYDQIIQNSEDWFGIGNSFEGLSFNVLSVDNEISWAVNQTASSERGLIGPQMSRNLTH